MEPKKDNIRCTKKSLKSEHIPIIIVREYVCHLLTWSSDVKSYEQFLKLMMNTIRLMS